MRILYIWSVYNVILDELQRFQQGFVWYGEWHASWFLWKCVSVDSFNQLNRNWTLFTNSPRSELLCVCVDGCVCVCPRLVATLNRWPRSVFCPLGDQWHSPPLSPQIICLSACLKICLSLPLTASVSCFLLLCPSLRCRDVLCVNLSKWFLKTYVRSSRC